MVGFVCYVQDEFARVSEQYREVSGGVTERSRILAQVTEDLESVKQEMDERGSSMTDGSKSHKDIISVLRRSKMNICRMFRSSRFQISAWGLGFLSEALHDFSLSHHANVRIVVLGRTSHILSLCCNFSI
jgi:hypothetical protein